MTAPGLASTIRVLSRTSIPRCLKRYNPLPCQIFIETGEDSITGTDEDDPNVATASVVLVKHFVSQRMNAARGLDACRSRTGNDESQQAPAF